MILKFNYEHFYYFKVREYVSCINVSFLNNGMTKDDLNSIAVINRIASNLENMQKLLDDKA